MANTANIMKAEPYRQEQSDTKAPTSWRGFFPSVENGLHNSSKFDSTT